MSELRKYICKECQDTNAEELCILTTRENTPMVPTVCPYNFDSAAKWEECSHI